ncbi:MAG: hypothetical protein JWP76_32, partial [Dactylosporangium sp.]|nr:hypothetical protein [Dactylosporangium sp.]
MPDPHPADAADSRSIGPSRRDLLRWAGLGSLAALPGGLLVDGLPAAASAEVLAQAGAAPRATRSSTFDPLRPPAVPLAVRSPYLTTWLPGDSLPGAWPTFWAGAVTAITGIARVDGTPYVFMGAPTGGYAVAAQTALATTATRSIYTIDAGPVTLTVTFFSPVDPANLQRQSVPMSYLTVTVTSRDGGGHQVSMYLDISGEWAHGDRSQLLSWGQQIVGGQNVLTCTPARPTVLGEMNDQASWGTVVWATDNVSGLTWQTGADVAVRANAASNGSLSNTNDTRQPRAISDNWPVFGFNRDLGTVGAAPTAPLVFSIGHVRTPAVSYLGAQLDPWWRTYWPDWQSMLGWFRADLDAALATGAAVDSSINDRARQAVGGGSIGDRYAAICSLALRQAFAGTELVDHGGTPWAVLKEISSNGDFSTVDVMYPVFPAYLHLSPRYLEMVLAPIFDYVENHGYPKAFAPHDLGTYPNAFGHINSGEEDMPVEESANMLIMTAAILDRMPVARASAYGNQHYRILHQWADYLVANLPDPGNQNQTDDFTGFIAHSVNLALKGIVGIAAMAKVAAAVGNTSDRDFYAAKARAYIASWVAMGQNSNSSHLKLTYDGADSSWSLKYNGYPDRLLNTNLVPPAVAAEEAAWYLQNQHPYGILLDPRNQYTKTDWELWTAGFLAAYPDARDVLIDKAYTFANTSGSRVPFTDWYDTNSGNQVGFADRPVIGGLFTLLTLRYGANGLTGHWSFDANQATDHSGGANDLATHGVVSFTTGRTGGALSLDGTSGYASAPRPVLRTDASFTVTAWVNLTDTGHFATAVSQDGVHGSGFYLQYSRGDNRWAFSMITGDADNAAAYRALSTAAPATQAWTHLAGVHDAEAGHLRLYVNGALQSSVPHTGTWNAAGNLQIGRGKWNGNPTDFFPGAIDEVRTFSAALSDSDIAASYQLGDRLVAAFPFAENGGVTAGDVVGGHALRLAGGAGWGGGISGTCLNLSGGGAYAAASASLVDTSGSFSVAAWVNLAAVSGYATAVSQDGVQASGFYLQYSQQDNAWAFAMTGADTAGATPIRALSPFPPKLGGWTHLVGVYDATAGQSRLYVDGRPAGSAAHPGAWTATGVFAVGRARWNGAPVDFFPGQIGQVQVWARPLSDTDVRVLV